MHLHHLLSLFAALSTSLLTSATSIAADFSTVDKELLTTHAPLIYQEVVGDKPYDYITRMDYDGNWNGSDNALNTAKFPMLAYAYAEVLAETADTLFLVYHVYHSLDWASDLWKHFPGQQHDNDFEGAMLAVDKDSNTVIAGESRWHNLLRRAARENIRQHTEKSSVKPGRTFGMRLFGIRKIAQQDGRVVLTISSMGHGVLFSEQPYPWKRGSTTSGIRYIPANTAQEPQPGHKRQSVNYALLPMTDLYDHVQDPRGPGHLYADEALSIYGLNLPIYFQGGVATPKGLLKKVSKPRLPWYWLPGPLVSNKDAGHWYFNPAATFNADFSLKRSTTYLRHSVIDYFAPPPAGASETERSAYYAEFLQRGNND